MRNKKFLIFCAIFFVLSCVVLIIVFEPGSKKYKGKTARDWHAEALRKYIQGPRAERSSEFNEDLKRAIEVLAPDFRKIALSLIQRGRTKKGSRYAAFYSELPAYFQRI